MLIPGTSELMTPAASAASANPAKSPMAPCNSPIDMIFAASRANVAPSAARIANSRVRACAATATTEYMPIVERLSASPAKTATRARISRVWRVLSSSRSVNALSSTPGCSGNTAPTAESNTSTIDETSDRATNA